MEEKDADGDWIKRDARYASLSESTAFVGWKGDRTSARLQGNHAFTLEGGADHEISGYNTFDLLGSRDIGFGTFSAGIQNLLDKQYSTVWGSVRRCSIRRPMGRRISTIIRAGGGPIR